jgi:hypothetical protein
MSDVVRRDNIRHSQKMKSFEASPVPGYVAADHPQQTKRKPLGLINHNVKRQKSAPTREQIVSKYQTDVAATWIDKTSTVSTWFNPTLNLECKQINPENLPTGFTRSNEDRFQYNFTDPESPKKSRYRPVAYRIPFLQHEGFYDQNMTVSHLCHRNWCYNWNHHVLELLAINKARNGCPAGPSCRHTVKCIIPGEYSEK